MDDLSATVCVLRQDAFCRFRTWFTLEIGRFGDAVVGWFGVDEVEGSG